jgi:(2R)-3-sulfolactate dehydrogenase (NADP+)
MTPDQPPKPEFDIVTLTLAEAEALADAALRAAGASPEAAASTARALALAEADGHGGHGLSRLPSYAAQSAIGKVRGDAVPHMIQIAPAALRVDAKGGFAFPAFDLILPALAALSAKTGIAVGTIVHSHHFGVAGRHAETLAEMGRVSLIFGNAPKAMAPWGATAPMLGTNPIAFAAPMPGGAPLVIDMATSTVARGKILAAREAGATSIPEGWALGPDGTPTTDPATALAGTVAPAGGAKGAALALMVEVLSACLAGGALGIEASSLIDADGPPPDLAQTLIVMDPGTLSGGAFAGRMTALAQAFAGAEGARLPGERRLGARAHAAAHGLDLPATLVARIRALAATAPPAAAPPATPPASSLAAPLDSETPP